MARIFISYRRADSEGYAGRIWDRLTAKFGPESVFMDVDSIAAGDSFPAVLTRTLSECGVLIAIVGGNWLGLRPDVTCRLRESNDFVRQELQTAFNEGIRILPVLVGGAQMPDAELLPGELRAFAHLNALEIRHSRFDADVAALIQGLETTLEEVKAARLKARSEEVSLPQPPSWETKKFLRQHLGEPRGMGAILFGPWQAQ